MIFVVYDPYKEEVLWLGDNLNLAQEFAKAFKEKPILPMVIYPVANNTEFDCMNTEGAMEYVDGVFVTIEARR